MSALDPASLVLALPGLAALLEMRSAGYSHHFPLSLYESLAQSAAPPEITAGSAPKP